ncbi:methylphosphotriester-DNA--protein-cysteine methyltransferase family protein [Bacillus salipaludis]|uniref:Methylphosphotriester-DNA--protein-cysteine methyltransferase family protein n=1 Tax=Bacillus salipaludis TaxID=2547811 RepID=A0A4R5VVM5_9BACI|nr:bifunctional transcriptional activator/DNA repair enzyme AdaA [Bacillus salipaludis]TDK63278.1 methylphosphotriester-DNA--protein-cysteine methyltransferase family protein [Bacillus salipaludis]
MKIGQGTEELTEEKWQAILLNDANYNQQFFYAVKSTGIFCKPSCKSRPPKKENVLIFKHAEEALTAHFRPCKRCKPTGDRLPDQEWVVQIKNYIDQNYTDKLTLEILADVCHGSPYHLHRTFKRITGVTPVEYIQQIRVNTARNYLIHSKKTIAEIALLVGLQNTPYFITLFKKKNGLTPVEYRNKEVEKSEFKE